MFKVYGDANDDVYLKLENHNGKIALIAIDSNGEHYENNCILVITHNGYLEKQPYINNELGFQCDKNGKIRDTANE